MEHWKNRIALVNGVSEGIGARICRQLVKDEMIVIGCTKNVAFIKDIAEEENVKDSLGELHAIKCDLSNEIEIFAMFHEIRRRFGRVDVCVNIAGFTTDNRSFKEGGNSGLRKFLQENVIALSICTRECLQLMEENSVNDGYIIQVIKCASSVVGGKVQALEYSDLNMFCGAHFMIRAFTEGLAEELKNAGSGIRVVYVTPELTGTLSREETLKSYMKTRLHKDEITARHVIHILSCKSPISYDCCA